MKNTFVTISSPGPNRDSSKGTREQPLWDEHATFIDQLVVEGFVLMGGPLVDEDGAMLIVNADDENEVREKGRITRLRMSLFAWQNFPLTKNQDQKDFLVPAWARLARGCSPRQPRRYDIVQEWRSLIKPLT